MLYYVVALVLSVFLAFLIKSKIASFFVKHIPVLKYVPILPLFFCAALRSFVGTDYMHYLYNKVPLILSGNSSDEFGFQLLTLFSMNILGHYQWLVAIMAFLTLFAFFSSWLRFSEKIYLSILIFVSTGFFYFSLNGMRQALAIAIFFFAVRYIINRKPLRYCFAILLASTIHLSALIFFPFYILAQVKLKKKNVVMTSLFLYLVWPVVAMLVYFFFFPSYYGYFEWGTIAGFNWRYLIFLLVIVLIDFYKKMDKVVAELPSNDKLNVYRNLSLFAFFACNASPTLTGESAFRVIYMFLPAICVYATCLISLKNKKIYVFFIICCIAEFIWISSQNPGWVIPYHSIFGDYRMSYETFRYELYN